MEKRLIDANALIKTFCNSCDGFCDKVDCDCTKCERSCRCEAVQEISEAPTVDAVEVVRCIECERRSPSVTDSKNEVWCRKIRAYVPVDGFCSYGERKKNE